MPVIIIMGPIFLSSGINFSLGVELCLCNFVFKLK